MVRFAEGAVLTQVTIILQMADGVVTTYQYADVKRAVRKVRTLEKHRAEFTVEVDKRMVTPLELEDMAKPE